MGYIKEPENIDFVINGKPWNSKEKKEISDFIKQYKLKNKILKKAKV